jgi:DNA-binding transcriptional LysR family regulator
MSRALGRLRDAIRDPLLVRAGRGLTLTPFALSLRGEVHDAFRQASALLRPSASASLRTIERKLVIRCTDVLAAMLIAPLQAALAQDAPRLRLQFVPQGEEDAEALRNGEVDLDVGVIHMLEPEIRVRRLFHDRVVAVVRRDHPLAGRRLTPRRLVAFPHYPFHVGAAQRDRLIENSSSSGSPAGWRSSFPSSFRRSSRSPRRSW